MVTPDHKHRLTPTGWLGLPEIILLLMFFWYAGLIEKRPILSNTMNSTEQLMKCQECGWDMDKKNRVGVGEGGESCRPRPRSPQLGQVFGQTCLTSWAFSFITKPRCTPVRIKMPWTKHTAHVLIYERTNGADELPVKSFLLGKRTSNWRTMRGAKSTRSTQAADNRQRSN